MLIRSSKVFIFASLQPHAQDGALQKAGLLANTVNEFNTARMSVVFYLVRKGLIYLVQLPSVIFMEMSEQQSVKANGNKDDYSKSSETPHWQTAFIFHHCKSEFKEKQESTQSSGLSRTTILSEGQLHFEIFKHIR